MKKTIKLNESELKKILIKVVNEALKPSQFRKYVKSFNRERYSDIFKKLGDQYSHDKNYNRIYIPLQSDEQKGPISNTQNEVTSFLEENGYKVIDYIKGTAKYGDSKNVTSIGKILGKLKAGQLMNSFVSDESRKALTSNISDLMIVISRHPYDIAGADTDRNWTNCMTMGHSDSQRVQKLKDELKDLKYKFKIAELEMSNQPGIKKTNPEDDYSYEYTDEFMGSSLYKLIKKIASVENEILERGEEGQNVKYLLNDVKEGSLISYLIKKNDKNIQNPISVLNIKPYVNQFNKSEFILISDNRMYGQGRPEFKSTVDYILYEVNGLKYGLFCLKDGIYSDDTKTVRLITTPEQENDFETIYPNIIPSIKHNLHQYISREYDFLLQDRIDGIRETLDEEGLDEKEIEEHINEVVNFFEKSHKKNIESIVTNVESYINGYDETELLTMYTRYISHIGNENFDIEDFSIYFLEKLDLYDLINEDIEFLYINKFESNN